MLLEAVLHLVAALIQTHVQEGILVHTGPPWLRHALDNSITNGPHASACTPEMVEFIRVDMHQRVQDGFSILLPVADAVRIFGESLKLYRIMVVPQLRFRPHLILNLSEKPDEGIPSVNETTDREVSPELMQFGPAFPHILLAIWKKNPAKGHIRVSKIDVTDAYHHRTL